MEKVRIKLNIEDARFVKTNGTCVGTILDAEYDIAKKVYIVRSNKTNEQVILYPNWVILVAEADFEETYQRELKEATDNFNAATSAALDKKKKSMEIIDNEKRIADAKAKQDEIDKAAADKAAADKAIQDKIDADNKAVQDAAIAAASLRADNQKRTQAILDTQKQLAKEINDVTESLPTLKSTLDIANEKLSAFNEDETKQTPLNAKEHTELMEVVNNAKTAYDNAINSITFKKSELAALPVLTDL